MDDLNGDADTPLHLACLHLQPDSVRTLLRRGTDEMLCNDNLTLPAASWGTTFRRTGGTRKSWSGFVRCESVIRGRARLGSGLCCFGAIFGGVSVACLLILVGKLFIFMV